MPLKKTVLIVEDDLPLRHLYRTALTVAGYEVGDGFDALRAIDSEPPDLVILDLALPRLNGHAVREELAARAHTRHIPVLIVAGTSGPEVYQIAADCVMFNPVSPDSLVGAVQKCLGSGSGA